MIAACLRRLVFINSNYSDWTVSTSLNIHKAPLNVLRKLGYGQLKSKQMQRSIALPDVQEFSRVGVLWNDSIVISWNVFHPRFMKRDQKVQWTLDDSIKRDVNTFMRGTTDRTMLVHIWEFVHRWIILLFITGIRSANDIKLPLC